MTGELLTGELASDDRSGSGYVSLKLLDWLP